MQSSTSYPVYHFQDTVTQTPFSSSQHSLTHSAPDSYYSDDLTFDKACFANELNLGDDVGSGITLVDDVMDDFGGYIASNIGLVEEDSFLEGSKGDVYQHSCMTDLQGLVH